MLLIVILFALAAVFGVLLLLRVLNSKKPRTFVVISHGVVAAFALVLLFFYARNVSKDTTINLIFFVFVALIGFYMFYREFFTKQDDLAKSAVPKPVALLHGIAAVISFVLLIITYVSA